MPTLTFRNSFTFPPLRGCGGAVSVRIDRSKTRLAFMRYATKYEFQNGFFWGVFDRERSVSNVGPKAAEVRFGTTD